MDLSLHSLAAGSEFVLFLLAVVGFTVVASAMNRLQRWREDASRGQSPRPTGSGEPRPPGSRPAVPPVARPQRPMRPAPPRPRPIIQERLPERMGGRRPPEVRRLPNPAGSRPPPVVPPAVPPRERPPIRPVAVPARDEPLESIRPVPVIVPVRNPMEDVRRIVVSAAEAIGDTREPFRALPALSVRSAAQPTAVLRWKPSLEEMRRAIVMTEILSPPLALRDT